MRHDQLRSTTQASAIDDGGGNTQPASTTALIRRFRDLRVLVIGDAMLDTYLEGTATRLCSEGPVPVVAGTAEYRCPGGAANTAANLRALDAEVFLLSVVGQDLAGSLLRSTLQRYGVSDRWLVEDENVSTLHKLRILANGQYMIRFDEGGGAAEGGAECYTEACQRRLLALLEEAYALCDLVVVSDYRYGVLSGPLVAHLQLLHAAQPKVLLVDSKALEHFQALKATVLTPNYQEACALVERMDSAHYVSHHFNPMSRDAVERLGKRLLGLLRAEHIVITLGEAGACLLNRQGVCRHFPAHSVPRADDVGAGDTFASALALTLAVGGSLEEAVRIGIDAAGIAVTHPRTVVVRYQELLQRVSLREYAAQASSSGVRLDLTSLVARLQEARWDGRTVVFTNGIFDILHAGHVQFLRQAKALGDILVVGINSDGSVQRRKGQGWPINSEQDRLALVEALEMVDYVVLFAEDTPCELIRLLQPHIHVKGGDYADEALPEAEVVREVGGRIVILPLAGTHSVIDRIITLAAREGQEHTTASKNSAVYEGATSLYRYKYSMQEEAL